MALYFDGASCALCGRPMTRREGIIGFTRMGIGRDPLVARLDDSVCHRACLDRWEHRDAFVRAWNREAQYTLGPLYYLTISRAGRVCRLGWFGRWLYRRGWGPWPWLPSRPHPGRPLLVFQVFFGEHSSFWRHIDCTGLHDRPMPAELGLPADLAADIHTWAEWDDRPATGNDRDRHAAEGERLWRELVRHLGDRYRVVHIGIRGILEPETDAS